MKNSKVKALLDYGLSAIEHLSRACDVLSVRYKRKEERGASLCLSFPTGYYIFLELLLRVKNAVLSNAQFPSSVKTLSHTSICI